MTVTDTMDLVAVANTDKEAKLANNELKGAYIVDLWDADYIEYADDEVTTPLADRFVEVNKDDVIVVEFSLANDDDEVGTLTAASYNAETIVDEYVFTFNMDTDTEDVELLVIVK